MGWQAPLVLSALIAGGIGLLDGLWLSQVNPWILATAPFDQAHLTNPVIGYSWLLDGTVIHKENLSPLLQSLTFNGYLAYPDGYYLRPVYPFLISTLSWLIGLKPAAFAINCLSYAAFVVATGWL